MFKHKKARSRSGVTSVEFAFVAPPFFLLIFGVIEFGRMMMVQQSLTNAAREGCRTAALATTTSGSEVEASVRDYLEFVLKNASDADEVRVTTPISLAGAASGTQIAVAVEVDYADVSWLPWEILGLNPTIRAEQIGKRE
jgi:Flp pilus assembly protein TadG